MAAVNNKHITTTKRRVPQLRFKEFDGEWNEIQLGKLGSFKGGGTPLSSNEDYWNGEIPWISSSDINENDIHSVNLTRFISKEAVTNSATKIIPKNSILFVSRVGIGKLAISREEICTSQDFANFSPKKDNSYFIGYYFLSKNKLLHQYSQGTSIKGYTSGDLKSIKLNLPSLPEQQKIAKFLTAVDSKLQQLNQKKELLEQYKKGVMQQLFSQQLRFKKDDGSDYPDWEEKKLGKLLIKHEEKSNTNNQYPVLTSSRKGIFFQKDYFAGQDVASKDNSGYNVVPKNYFTYRHMSDDLDFKFNINTICDRGIVSTLYPVFTTTNELDDYFLLMKLNFGQEFKRYAILQKQGGSRTYMYYKKLEKLILEIPCIEEQQKIANYLSAIDTKIETVTQQIEATQQFKKGLLQQMFV